MLKGLQRLVGGGRLLRELLRALRGLHAEIGAVREEIGALHAAGERIAVAMEFANRQQYGAPPLQASESPAPEVEVTYVDSAQVAEQMDIELRLTHATGQPPTEDEMFAEWERRRQGSPGPAQ